MIFALENFWESGAWTLGSLIAMALVLAVLQEHWQQFWKTKPKADFAVEKSLGEIVNPIVSPIHTYELIEPVGSGDLCDVHRANAGASEFLLKITRVPGGEDLMAKEFLILQRLHKQAKGQVYREFFPEPLESFSHQGRQIDAYAWREGLITAEQILDKYHHGLDARHLGWMFNRVLEALGFVHQADFVHGAVLPPHLLFHTESHGLLLAGWIHAENLGTSLKVVPDRYKEWYPPECRDKLPTTPSVDIYLAAKSLIYLAGGDPIKNTMPAHIPPQVQQFVKGCLLESPSMRSQNAWEVRQEFGNILEGLSVGPSVFHPLDMS
jgi:hypothetical protein